MPDPAGPAEAAATEGLWRFGPEDAPILVENADLVLPYLPYYVAGWPFGWAGDGGTADIRISEESDGAFRVRSDGPGCADFAFDNPYDAANGLAGALISIHVARRPDTVCLHAGAARIGGELAVVIGDSFAGKSSVALHLAVLGHRFFGDDQIALTLGSPPVGTCLGLMPKVRTPLPEDCGDAFREFVDGYTAMEGDGVAYLKLWDGEAGTFGETAPVRALILLDRRSDAASDLVPATGSELMKTLMSTAFAPHIEAADLLRGLAGLAEAAELYRLTFSSSREAASLLSARFRSEP